MCKKVKHPTHEAACITAKRIKNKQLNVYKCGECHAWHLGEQQRAIPHTAAHRPDTGSHSMTEGWGGSWADENGPADNDAQPQPETIGKGDKRDEMIARWLGRKLANICGQLIEDPKEREVARIEARVISDIADEIWVGDYKRAYTSKPKTISPQPSSATVMSFPDLIWWLTQVELGRWSWASNSRCKYVEIGIDTRSGVYAIKDRDQNVITPVTLGHQYTGKPTGVSDDD